MIDGRGIPGQDQKDESEHNECLEFLSVYTVLKKEDEKPSAEAAAPKAKDATSLTSPSGKLSPLQNAKKAFGNFKSKFQALSALKKKTAPVESKSEDELEEEKEQRKQKNIIAKSRAFVASALESKDNISGDIGRIFNEFPWKFQNVHAVNPRLMKQWTDEFFGLILPVIEKDAVLVQGKSGTVALRQHDGGERTQKVKFMDLKDPAKKPAILLVVNEILIEARKQILRDGKLKNEIIQLLQLQPLQEKYPEQKELILLQVINSYVSQIILGNIGSLLVKRVKQAKEDLELTERQINTFNLQALFFQQVCQGMLFADHIILDDKGNEIVTPHITEYFKNHILGIEVPKSSVLMTERCFDAKEEFSLDSMFAPAEELFQVSEAVVEAPLAAVETPTAIASPAGEVVLDAPFSETAPAASAVSASPDEHTSVPIENSDSAFIYGFLGDFKQVDLATAPVFVPDLASTPAPAAEVKLIKQPSKLTSELFASYFSDKFPLDDVPEKFQLSNFAAVTKEEKLQLISMIMMDDMLSSGKDDLNQRLDFVCAQMTLAQQMHADASHLSAPSDDFAILQKEMLRINEIRLRKISEGKETDAPTPEQERQLAEAKKLKDIIKVFNTNIHQAYPEIGKTRLGHSRTLSVASIKDLPNRVKNANEFVAILQAERDAVKKGIFSGALDACLQSKEFKVFNDEVEKNKKKSEKHYLNAIILLKYVADKETTKFSFLQKPMEVQAARSVAHNLIKLSLIADPLRFSETEKSILTAVDSILKVEKLDSEFAGLLRDVAFSMKPDKKYRIT